MNLTSTTGEHFLYAGSSVQQKVRIHKERHQNQKQVSCTAKVDFKNVSTVAAFICASHGFKIFVFCNMKDGKIQNLFLVKECVSGEQPLFYMGLSKIMSPP